MQKLNSRTSRATDSTFIKGQLWQLLDKRFIQIGHVGRLLVHHRTIVPWVKWTRPHRETLSSIKDLQHFLIANQGALVENRS